MHVYRPHPSKMVLILKKHTNNMLNSHEYGTTAEIKDFKPSILFSLFLQYI